MNPVKVLLNMITSPFDTLKTRKAIGRSLLEAFMIPLFLLVLSGTGLATTLERKQPGILMRLLEGDTCLSDNEMEGVKKGKVVTKRLNTDVKGELAVIGISRICVPREFFTSHYGKEGLSIETGGAETKGDFSDSPDPGDIRNFTLPPHELKELAECEPQSCKVKANDRLMKAFRELDKSAPDFEARGNSLIRQVMADYVRGYLKGGNAALIEYRDKKDPVRIADEFRDLLRESDYLRVLAPELHRYLEKFPEKGPYPIKNSISWMTENFGGRANRPVFSINHIVSYHPPGRVSDMVVVSKQLYASHYFEAALGLTVMVKDPEGPETGVYLVHISRSRIDILREIPEFMAGHLFQGVHGRLNKKMTRLKRNMEKAYRGWCSS